MFSVETSKFFLKSIFIITEGFFLYAWIGKDTNSFKIQQLNFLSIKKLEMIRQSDRVLEESPEAVADM